MSKNTPKIEFRILFNQTMTTILYIPNFYRQLVIKHFPGWEMASELKKIDDQIRLLQENEVSGMPYDTVEIARLLKKSANRIINGVTSTESHLLNMKKWEIQEFMKMALDLCGFPPLDCDSTFGRYVFRVDEIPANKLIAINEILMTKYDLRLE